MQTVINPQTGRPISTNGRTYKRLFPTGKIFLDSQSDDPQLRANALWYMEALQNPEKFGFKSLRGVRMSRTYDLNHTTPKRKGLTTLIDNPDRYANNPHMFDFPNVDNGTKIRKLPKWIRERMAQQRKILYSELWAYIDKKYPILSDQEKTDLANEYYNITKQPLPTKIPKPTSSQKIDIASLASGSKIKKPTVFTKKTEHQKRMELLDKKINALKEYRKNRLGYDELQETLRKSESVSTTPPGFSTVEPTYTNVADVATNPPGYKPLRTKIHPSPKFYDRKVGGVMYKRIFERKPRT